MISTIRYVCQRLIAHSANWFLFAGEFGKIVLRLAAASKIFFRGSAAKVGFAVHLLKERDVMTGFFSEVEHCRMYRRSLDVKRIHLYSFLILHS